MVTAKNTALGDVAPFTLDSEVMSGFSCPFENFIEPLAPLIAVEYGRGIAQRFIERHWHTLEESCPTVLSTVQPWFDGMKLSGAVGWDFCFGDIYRAMHVATATETAALAAEIAMHLGSVGMPCQWSASFNHPLRLRWGDVLLPATNVITVESDGRVATISIVLSAAEVTYRFTRTSEGWSSELPRIPTVTHGGLRLVVLSREALVLRDFDDLIINTLPNIDLRMIDALNRAVALIESYAPTYLPWIRRVLHFVFILQPRTDTITSGSVEHYLGLFHITAHAASLPLAELLVHEAAHQHMNLLTKLGPVDDGTDTQSYYSPPVDKQRRLPLIMAAYHAFANVLLFYRLCRRNGLDEGRECDRQEKILLPWLETLEAPLSNNSALTELGRSLWQPLKKQLQATR